MSGRIISLFLAPVAAAVLWLHVPLRAEEQPVRDLPLKKLTSEENEQMGKAEADFQKANDIWNRDRSPEALKLFRPALAVLKRLVGPEDARMVQRRAELANILSRTSAETQAEAADEYRAVIAIRDRFLGPKDEFTLWFRVNLADALRSQQKSDEAAKELKAAIPIIESVFGPAHEGTLSARRQLASVLEEQGKRAESEKEHRGILSAMCRAVGPDNEEAMDRWELLDGNAGDDSSAWLGQLGNSEEAENTYRAAVAVMERARSAERRNSVLYHRNLFFLQRRLAECLEAQGKFQDALALLKQIADDPQYGNGLSIQTIRNRVVEALMKTKEPAPRKEGELDMSIVRGLEECGMSLTEAPDNRGVKQSTVDYPFLGSIPVRAKTYILQAKSLGFANQRWTLYWTRDGFFIGAFYRRAGFSTKWDRKYVEEIQEARGEKVVGLAKAPTQARFQKILEVIRFTADSEVIDQVRIRRVLMTVEGQLDGKPAEIYSVTVWGKGVMSYSRGTLNCMRIGMDKDGKALFQDNGL